MAETILDGTGSGKVVKVDSDNRMHVHSVGETIGEQAATDGYSYNINTGVVNLSTANESYLLFLENKGVYDLHIQNIGYLLGNSTGGSGDLQLKVVKNPSEGTLIDTATSVPILENKNTGSSNVIDVNAYVGVEGSTITDGDDFYLSLLSSPAKSYVIATGNVVVPRGASIAISVTPQASNTSMNVLVFLSLLEYRLDL